MAGEVPLVAEGGLATVTLVGLVTVDLQRVSLERGLLGEPAVALVAEEGSVLWEGREESNEMGKAWASSSMGHKMGLEWWRGEARASDRRRRQAQTFVVNGACTVPLPPDLLVHTATTCMAQESKVIMSHLSFRATQAASRKPASRLDIFQRGPQRHANYQASSEGWMLSSGATPAPLEVLNLYMYKCLP